MAPSLSPAGEGMGLRHLVHQPFSQTWARFFPHVPPNQADTYIYPRPLSGAFWRAYAGAVYDFVGWAMTLATVVKLIDRRSAKSSCRLARKISGAARGARRGSPPLPAVAFSIAHRLAGDDGGARCCRGAQAEDLRGLRQVLRLLRLSSSVLLASLPRASSQQKPAGSHEASQGAVGRRCARRGNSPRTRHRYTDRHRMAPQGASWAGKEARMRGATSVTAATSAPAPGSTSSTSASRRRSAARSATSASGSSAAR